MYRQRIKIFLAIIAVVFAGLAMKLWSLQLVKGTEYRQQFEDSLKRIDLLPPVRGQILDRNGNVLATDRRGYDFCLNYQFMVQDERWVTKQVSRIKKAGGLSTAEAQRIYQERFDRTWALARQVADEYKVNLDDEVNRILERVDTIHRRVGGKVEAELQDHPVVFGMPRQVDLDGTVGASIEPSLRREYPYGNIACHIIGTTALVSEKEQDSLNIGPEEGDRLARLCRNYRDSDTIGKSGVEKMAESMLRGTRGYRQTSRTGDILQTAPAVNGKDVRLSIDIDLQAQLTQILAKRGQGSAVVIDIKTGQILAMVSVPTYDLNTYRTDLKRLNDDEVDLPLMHRAIGRRYPPGSTAKPVAALAALGCGLSPDRQFECRHILEMPGAGGHFKCDATHGWMSMVSAIQQSCNIYFYNVGRFVGADSLAQWMRLMGYGSLCGTGLPEEVAGNIEPKDRPTQIADPMQWAIGQGTFDATPLQVANAMAAVARGQYLSPAILTEGGPQQVSRDIPLRPDQIDVVRKGMWEVVNTRQGTAFTPFHDASGHSLVDVTCGKTGTADAEPQRVNFRNADGTITRTIVHGGESGANMAWFAGYTSYTDPQIAFAVVIEYVPEHGSQAAAPIAVEIVRMCKEKGYIH